MARPQHGFSVRSRQPGSAAPLGRRFRLYTEGFLTFFFEGVQKIVPPFPEMKQGILNGPPQPMMFSDDGFTHPLPLCMTFRSGPFFSLAGMVLPGFRPG